MRFSKGISGVPVCFLRARTFCVAEWHSLLSCGAAEPHLLICELLAQVGHHVSQLQQGHSQSLSRPGAGVTLLSCRATVPKCCSAPICSPLQPARWVSGLQGQCCSPEAATASMNNAAGCSTRLTGQPAVQGLHQSLAIPGCQSKQGLMPPPRSLTFNTAGRQGYLPGC